LRKQARFDRTVMFALSGLTTADSIEQTVDSGFDYFAVKPLDPTMLLEAVHAPRQDSLILLSEQLIMSSELIKQQASQLVARAHRIRERSEQIMQKWNAFRRLETEL